MAAYGLNSLALSLRFIKNRDESPALLPEPEKWPTVTVQLPIFNERHTVARLIKSVARLDYPRDKLEIQILDDSTDDTPEIIRSTIASFEETNLQFHHLRRQQRTNFKAGALAAGMQYASGEFLAIFDADFVPPPNFLRRTIPTFAAANVGCVQTRWGHLNRDYSRFTRTQALGIDSHFIIEQHTRSQTGMFINFNGTAGVWRRACIEDAGGWQGDTLTEDLDLSYRAQLRGWKLEYRSDIMVPAEIPVQISAFKKQQARWATGSIQTARKILPALWRAPLSRRLKLQGTLHLTGYLVHPLIMTVILLALPVAFSKGWVLNAAALFAISAIGPPLLAVLSQHALGQLSRIRDLPWLVLLGLGLSLNNTRAVLAGLTGHTGSFQRTPKYGILDRAQDWSHSTYARAERRTPLGEILLASLALASFLAIRHGANWGFYPWLTLYGAAFMYVSGLDAEEMRAAQNVSALAPPSTPLQEPH